MSELEELQKTLAGLQQKYQGIKIGAYEQWQQAIGAEAAINELLVVLSEQCPFGDEEGDEE